VLRLALRDYLGRVRGVVADAERVVVTSGYCQGRSMVCRALVALGAKRIAIEDPCHDEVRQSVANAGVTLVPVPVDAEGIRVDLVEQSRADAVIMTPAHQYPTGAVLSGARRGALLDWLRRRGAIAIEDDYDAEYR
jgi:GntR family transcriptional regulator/MocR family aminotransferase